VYVQNDGDATTLDHHYHHNFAIDFAPQKHPQNGVDKYRVDGQNPYHSDSPPMTAICKHPIVKVVAREDDIEFVECQQCGEVFDSAEYVDIAIEEEDALADHLPED
jgi:hypothetical protein